MSRSVLSVVQEVLRSGGRKRTGKCAIAVLTDDVDRVPDLGVGSVVFANQPARCKAIVQLPAVHTAQPVLVVSDSKQRQT